MANAAGRNVRSSSANSTNKAKATNAAAPATQEIRERKRQGFGIFTIKLTLFLLCFGLFTYYFWPWGKPDPEEFKHSHIMNLNSTSFEPYVLREDGKFRIVKFYANWCDHCKELAPHWSQAALQNQDDSVEFLQVECSKNNKLCRKANVQGFPSLKIFHQGRIGYSRIGALNDTELQSTILEGVNIARQGHKKFIAEEFERQKDEAEERQLPDKDLKTEL